MRGAIFQNHSAEVTNLCDTSSGALNIENMCNLKAVWCLFGSPSVLDQQIYAPVAQPETRCTRPGVMF